MSRLKNIYDRFGADVAALDNGQTEDKRMIWYMQKHHTVTELPNENIRQKMLALADKVANLRNMLIDYKRMQGSVLPVVRRIQLLLTIKQGESRSMLVKSKSVLHVEKKSLH